MFTGELEAIYIGPMKAGPMHRVESTKAIAGAGLEGNRYSLGGAALPQGAAPKPGQQVTLIEAEALEAAARDCGLVIEASQTRRNLLVRGVPLNHLVGREFQIGQVRLRGIKLCEPCPHLEKLTVSGIEAALFHRGGLRAEILTTGELHPGDEVRPS